MATPTKKRIPKSNKPAAKRTLFWYIKWIIIVIGLIGVCWQAYSILELHEEQVQLEEQLQDLQQKNQALEEQKNKLQNPQEIEKVARDELGLVKPGEVPYVK
ncbi:MAG: septum formation initiator family protein [Veillonellaceae bacterium]|nr:septum formation initiator family protein [Veillonellaceae bacterium]